MKQICKLRNEEKRDHTMNSKNLDKSFLDVHVSLIYKFEYICISKKLYFVIDDVFYIYAIYFLGQKSRTLPNTNKHCPIPYK